MPSMYHLPSNMPPQLIRVNEIKRSDGLVCSPDGAILHPQPTDDPLDPLNWSKLRKHTILGILIWMYFMFTYITTTNVPSFPELQKLFNITYTQVNLTVAMPSLGLALGPLIWSSLSDTYGRRIIFITGTTIALLATIGTIFSRSYGTYMVARAVQGFGASPGGTVGMAIINDLFFEYERGQKLGLWVLAINTGLLLGPVIGGFISLAGQIWVNGLTAMLFGALLILELFFLPETLYPRSFVLARSKRASGHSSSTKESGSIEIKRTTNLPFINLMPVPGMEHPKPWDLLIRFGATFKFPVVAVVVVVFCFSWYWWILSIITMIPAAYAGVSPSTQGLLFLGLLLGTWFAELFCSGRLSDWLSARIEQTDGERAPEARLWLVYPAALLSAAGLILWGISIDHKLHWMVGQVAFFLFAIGLQTGNTAISSYIVDCYPLQSMSVITFYSVFLDLSALIDPFFIADWTTSWGFTNAFAAQGIITLCVVVFLIILVQRFGASIRARSGTPSWVNPGCDIV